MMKPFAAVALGALLIGHSAMAENRIDTQLPNAPELAAYGAHKVGVRTLDVVVPDQVDVLTLIAAPEKPETAPTYDRALTVEVWYPAAENATGDTSFRAFLRDGTTAATLYGQAMRDAAPAEGAYPLAILSHGWPGNRYLMSHLAENLASKGYVVASIDHLESTYRTFQPVEGSYYASFPSTLRNRPLDQKAVLNELAAKSNDDSSFLNGLVDADNSAVIGYSMGGYGAVILAGGGVTQAAADMGWANINGSLDVNVSGSESHMALPDPRIKTAIAFAPWGRTQGFWDAETLKGISIPTLFVAGSEDDVSGYENGVRQIWEEASNSDRALLTFNHANHNAAAPIPAPAEANVYSEALGFNLTEHYADAVWDTARMNNVAQHFVTAWLDLHLKGDQDKAAYLELIPASDDGVWSLKEDGSAAEDHSYWTGFPNRWAKGLRFERLEAE